jgi:hypothetical protein
MKESKPALARIHTLSPDAISTPLPQAEMTWSSDGWQSGPDVKVVTKVIERVVPVIVPQPTPKPATTKTGKKPGPKPKEIVRLQKEGVAEAIKLGKTHNIEIVHHLQDKQVPLLSSWGKGGRNWLEVYANPLYCKRVSDIISLRKKASRSRPSTT